MKVCKIINALKTGSNFNKLKIYNVTCIFIYKSLGVSQVSSK